MRALVQQNASTADFHKIEIGHLADFLNINLGDLDQLSMQEQAMLLKQLVAISQMKLTRLAIRH